MSGGMVVLLTWVGLSLQGAPPVGERPAGKPGDKPAAASPGQASPEDEREAFRLLELGNVEFIDNGRPREAAGYYRQALKRWDHPAIHYNLAMALRDMGNMIEARQHLESAVRHGPEFMDDYEKFERAKNVKAALEGELVKLEITCDEAGGQVSINGHAGSLSCPGAYEEWLVQGQHSVRMTKAGFTNATEYSPSLQKGQKAVIHLEMYRDSQWTEKRSLWPWWGPWTAVTVGAAALATGGVLHWQARNEFSQYDAAISECAPSTAEGVLPCPAEMTQGFEHHRTLGNRKQTWAGISYAGAGALIAAGAYFIYLNREQPYPVNPANKMKIAVTPSLGAGSGGAVLTLGF